MKIIVSDCCVCVCLKNVRELNVSLVLYFITNFPQSECRYFDMFNSLNLPCNLKGSYIYEYMYGCFFY